MGEPDPHGPGTGCLAQVEVLPAVVVAVTEWREQGGIEDHEVDRDDVEQSTLTTASCLWSPPSE